MTSDRVIADRATLAIGQAVAGALVAAGLSQEASAGPIGLSINSLSRRINGHLPFTYPELRAVSRLTGTPVSELVSAAERIESRAAGVAPAETAKASA